MVKEIKLKNTAFSTGSFENASNHINHSLQTLGIKDNNPGVSTGLQWLESKGVIIESFSPVDGKLIASVTSTDRESYNVVINKAGEAFKQWRMWPSQRGVFSLGFHTHTSPQTNASIVFQLHTATGKLKAVIIPTIPNGCHCSYMR